MAIDFNPDQLSLPHDGDPAVLRQLIETMESILEVFPEDVSAMESLAAAYQQAGDLAKFADTAVNLTRLISGQGNWEKAYEIVSRVLDDVPDHQPALDEQARILESLRLLGIDTATIGAAGRKIKTPEPAAPERPRHVLSLDLSGELELGWLLLQRNLLTQEQYELAVQGLTESKSGAGADACLSLLLEISTMDGINMPAILGTLSAETSTPMIAFNRVELNPEIAALIPFQDARRLGVLPFERLGKEIMVATLNPVDDNLRSAVATYLDTRVHFFLVAPDEFQSVLLEVMAKMQEEDEPRQ